MKDRKQLEVVLLSDPDSEVDTDQPGADWAKKIKQARDMRAGTKRLREGKPASFRSGVGRK